MFTTRELDELLSLIPLVDDDILLDMFRPAVHNVPI